MMLYFWLNCCVCLSTCELLCLPQYIGRDNLPVFWLLRSACIFHVPMGLLLVSALLMPLRESKEWKRTSIAVSVNPHCYILASDSIDASEPRLIVHICDCFGRSENVATPRNFQLRQLIWMQRCSSVDWPRPVPYTM